MTTDREPTDHEQCRLAENCDSKYIFYYPQSHLAQTLTL